MKIRLLNRCSSAALTLIEVMMAVAIIGVSVVSLYLGMSSGFATIETARENLRATQIMVERLETIRLYTLNQLTNDAYVSNVPFTNWYNFQSSNGFPYIGKITVSGWDAPNSENYAEDVRLVTIELKWNSGGRERSRSMHTLVARDGLQDYVY